MMGLAGSVTPAKTGTIMIVLTGDCDNATASRGVQIQLRTGTGTAPTNGATATGTQRGATVNMFQNNASVRTPFTVNAVVSGLTSGTTYWIDTSIASTGGAGTARIRDISISTIEI